MPIPSATTQPIQTLQIIREYLEARELDADSRQDLLDILDGIPPDDGSQVLDVQSDTSHEIHSITATTSTIPVPR
jgi:hypothetical protein